MDNTPQAVQGFRTITRPLTRDEIRAELYGLAEVITDLKARAEVMAEGSCDPASQYTAADEIADDLAWHLGRHAELSRLLGEMQIAEADRMDALTADAA